MSRTTTLAVVVLVVAATIAVPVAAAISGPAGEHTTDTPTPDGNATAPGEKLSGVVAVQDAELDGEMQERTFGVRIARAETDASKADVVADQVTEVRQRLDELEQRKQRLQDARENGSISEGEYRARMARVVAEIENARRMANHSARVAGDLPADVLAEHGVDVEAIRTLRDRAANMSGPEVAAVARSIAGDQVGKSIGGTERPEDVPGIGNRSNGPGNGPAGDGAGEGARNGTGDGADPGDDAGNGTSAGNASEVIQRADAAVQKANETIRRAEQQVGEGDDEAKAALQRARANLTAAADALAEARAAAGDGESAAAVERAETALERARTALEQAREAIDGAGQGGGAP